MKQRAAAHGRPPGELCLLPGLGWIIGDTEAEAQQRADDLIADFVVPPGGLGLLSTFLKLDISQYDLDDPVPELPPLEDFQGGIHRMRLVYAFVATHKPTLRQLAARGSLTRCAATAVRGHRGTACGPTSRTGLRPTRATAFCCSRPC